MEDDAALRALILILIHPLLNTVEVVVVSTGAHAVDVSFIVAAD